MRRIFIGRFSRPAASFGQEEHLSAIPGPPLRCTTKLRYRYDHLNQVGWHVLAVAVSAAWNGVDGIPGISANELLVCRGVLNADFAARRRLTLVYLLPMTHKARQDCRRGGAASGTLFSRFRVTSLPRSAATTGDGFGLGIRLSNGFD